MDGGPNRIHGNQLRIRLAKSDSESGTQNRCFELFQKCRKCEHNLLGSADSAVTRFKTLETENKYGEGIMEVQQPNQDLIDIYIQAFTAGSSSAISLTASGRYSHFCFEFLR